LVKEDFLKYLKRVLIVICILNFTDMVLTYIGVTTGHAIEINPFMVKYVNNIYSMIVLKVMVPVTVAAYLYYRQLRSEISKFKIKKKLLNICMYAYILININHLIWIVIALNKS